MEDHARIRGSLRARVAVDSETGCWNYTRALDRDGYARYKPGRRWRTTRGHRISYVVFRGPIPAGMLVCHRCDNRRCVNPDHLFVGTDQDNHDDMWRKGRAYDRSGDKNPRARLNGAQVALIHAMRADGVTLAKIAADFGVTQTTISDIVRGKRRPADFAAFHGRMPQL